MRPRNSIGHLTALAAAALAASVLSLPAQALFVDQRSADAPAAPTTTPPIKPRSVQPDAAARPPAPAVVAVTLRLPAGERLLVGLRDALAPHGVQVWIAPDDAAVHARSARELRASGPTLGAAIDALLRQAGLQGGFLDRDPQRLGISTVAIAAMAPAALTGAQR